LAPAWLSGAALIYIQLTKLLIKDDNEVDWNNTFFWAFSSSTAYSKCLVKKLEASKAP
jgi:hypothetical protein